MDGRVCKIYPDKEQICMDMVKDKDKMKTVHNKVVSQTKFIKYGLELGPG